MQFEESHDEGSRTFNNPKFEGEINKKSGYALQTTISVFLWRWSHPCSRHT
jgi:hypothetical protein